MKTLKPTPPNQKQIASRIALQIEREQFTRIMQPLPPISEKPYMTRLIIKRRKP